MHVRQTQQFQTSDSIFALARFMAWPPLKACWQKLKKSMLVCASSWLCTSRRHNMAAALTHQLNQEWKRALSKETQETSYRAFRVLTHVILALVVVFFLFGDRIIWINCLTGFAWRTWLLLYSLPAWITALRATARPASGESMQARTPIMNS